MFSTLLMASSFWGDITNYFANFKDTTNTCRTIFLWLALALAIAFIVCKFAIKKEQQPLVNKVSLIVAIAFSAASIITFAVCSFIEDEIVAITFYPLLVFVVCCIVGGLIIAVYPNKTAKIVVASVIAAALVAALVCMIVYYATGDASDHNWITLEKGNNIGLYISAAVVAAAIVVLAFFADKNKQPFDSKAISFAAICIALSFALSYVRILKMPMGGSITLASTLPIMLFSFMYGSRKGILAGLIYGALQAIQDPWILHPAQFLLDYGVAFAGIGLAGCIKDFGLFKNNVRAQFSLGALIAGAFRFVSHFFSGAFAFGSYGASYAEEYGIAAINNPYVYSLLYQTLYVIPDLLIVIVVGVILFSSKNFVNQVGKYSHKKTAATQTTAAAEAAPAEDVAE